LIQKLLTLSTDLLIAPVILHASFSHVIEFKPSPAPISSFRPVLEIQKFQNFRFTIFSSYQAIQASSCNPSNFAELMF
jgi:hypothetical protein